MSETAPRALTTFSALDVPDEIATQVMSLLQEYDPDIYVRDYVPPTGVL